MQDMDVIGYLVKREIWYQRGGTNSQKHSMYDLPLLIIVFMKCYLKVQHDFPVTDSLYILGKWNCMVFHSAAWLC